MLIVLTRRGSIVGDHPRTAGSASALLGVLQYTTGAAAAPLVGILGAQTALPMAVVIATVGISALVVFLLLGRHIGPQARRAGEP